MRIPRYILPVIVVAQFCCTSLWFAGNGVMDNLVNAFGLSSSALGHLTSAVQFGFILGTLVFAILTIADRFSPSKVFFVCALLGASFNLATILESNTFWSLFLLRFGTGFFLAGIYPVGMKISADYFQKGLGRSLGFLVGALVVGTSFPHFLKSYGNVFDWEQVILTTSILAVLGGLLIFIFVPNGPFRKASQGMDFSTLFKVFKNKKFKASAFGYFGHVWELYSFWAFVPVMLSTFQKQNPSVDFNIPFYSFLIIGLGGVGCVIGGFISEKIGVKKTATIALSLSGICCLVSPLILGSQMENALIPFLIFWGLVVIADSPLFSTLVAQNAPSESKGTALTIVNCLGFFITIFSIQLLTYLQTEINVLYLYMILAIGPLLGLIGLWKKT